MSRLAFKKIIADNPSGTQLDINKSTAVRVFVAGSALLATIYTTKTGGTLKSNPFNASDGVAEFYAEPGLYDIECRIGDTVVAEFKNYALYDPAAINLQTSLPLQFETVAAMKSGTAMNYPEVIEFSQFEGRQVKTVYNNLTSRAGGADYVIWSLAAYRTAIGNPSWVPDGDGSHRGGDHYVGGGTAYIAVLNPASDSIMPEQFGDTALTIVHVMCYNYAAAKAIKLPHIESANSIPRKTSFSALCRATAAGNLQSGTGWQPSALGNNSRFISSDHESGVLLKNSPAEFHAGTTFLDISLPYVVGIGDSIMMCRFNVPVNFGGSRLMQPSGGSFAVGYDPDFAQFSGQTSREVQNTFNVPFLNQGIGGQTTVQILARFDRDALAETVAVGDALPNKTIDYAGQKPIAVWLHAGVNDVRQGVALATTKANFRAMAQKCRDAGVIFIVDNIGPAADHNVTQTNNLIELNNFLRLQLKTEFPEIYLLDFMHWGSGGTNSPTTLAAGLFEDELHPNRQGYFEWVRYVHANYDLPICLNSLEFNAAFSDSGLPNFAAMRRFELDGVWYEINSGKERNSISLPAFASADEPVKRIVPFDCDTRAGSGEYFGFCAITAKLGTMQSFGADRLTENVVASGTVQAGVLSSSYPEFGIFTVDNSTIASGFVTVRTTHECKSVDVYMVGGSNNSPQRSVRWAVSGHSGTKNWNIWVYNSSTGASSTTLSEYNFQFRGFY